MLAALLVVFAASFNPAITWETKLDRATAAARESNQPVLIEFWAAWCEPCKDMDRDVYADERVGEAMRRVHPVKVDVDREAGLRRKYDISGTPTLIVTDASGRELFRYAGSLPADKMIRLLEALPRDISRINQLSAAIDARKEDFALLGEFGRELREAGFYRSSNTWFEKALKTKEGRRRGEARTTALTAMARNALELRLYVDAVRLCEQALRELPAGSPQAEAVRADLERARRAQAGGPIGD